MKTSASATSPPVAASMNSIAPSVDPCARNGATRMQLQPQLDGDVVPPSDRTLVMVDRSNGQSREPVSGEDNSGAGATITSVRALR
jgi:hypothetical protein